MRNRGWSTLGTLAVVLLVLAGAGWLVLSPRSPARSLLGDAPTGRSGHPTIELDRFSARHERGADSSRLNVFMRMRTDTDEGLPCFVFVVAHNRSNSKNWAIWPPQPPGLSVTASGHFHGATPTAGHSMTLSTSWQRITALLPEPATGGALDLVVVYIVGPEGSVLLSRPYAVMSNQ